jgi:hypothetical protein
MPTILLAVALVVGRGADLPKRCKVILTTHRQV